MSYLERVLLALGAPLGHGLQLLFDAPLEAIVHGLFLQLALGTGAKNEDFLSAWSWAELDLEPRMHFTPVPLQQLLFELAQRALVRAKDIAAPALPQEQTSSSSCRLAEKLSGFAQILSSPEADTKGLESNRPVDVFPVICAKTRSYPTDLRKKCHRLQLYVNAWFTFI